jgi:flagellar biosynthesis GTPase FlhF
MKFARTILVSAFLGFLLLSIGKVAMAQDAYEDIPEAALASDSPFYFLRGWQETIETFVANFQSDEAKINLELRFAERRAGEIEHVTRVGRNDLIEKLRTRWEENLQKAQERAETLQENREELLQRVLEATDRHRAVLERVLEQVPEQAQEAIQRAIDNSATLRTKILENFSGSKLEEVKSRLEERLNNTIEKLQLKRNRLNDLLNN